ncbi:Collagen binding domain protein [Clostridium liquoris]|jgi:LPXTG-motif cell wall-anchored protein|uniref:Collagen binding domain protein n=1 Tax=Clostridium liquoris TaxID=1289519 RepID=A0A2T0B588_9CLOT|nr:LPXTG cell wall anchor domain-containing protein [Clostridium liquoris]PRR79050.1 Collagen binding domain protein [Clostridium liquoris]
MFSRKGKKGKLSIIFMIILTLLSQPSLPVQAFGTDGAENKMIDTIKSVVVKDSSGNIIDENTEYPIEQGSKVSLFYTWEIEDSQGVKAGDYTEVQVPKAFSIFNYVEGDLILEDGQSVGRFYLSLGGKLRLVYNEYAENHSEVSGTVQFNSEFNKQVIKGENPVKIVFPIYEGYEKELVIRFKPNNVSGSVAKSGMANKKVNGDKIAWTIDVNKSLNKLDNAVVEDILGEGLHLDKDSVQVHKLNVDLDGNAAEGETVSKDAYKVNVVSDGFKVELGNINNAYRIVYNTDIADNTKTIFDNKAKFQGGESEAKVTVTKGKTIEKKGTVDKSFNGKKITWTIDINKSLSDVKGAIVKDSIEAGLSLDKSSIKVYKLTLDDNGNVIEKSPVNASDYTVEYDSNDKPLSFQVKLGNISDAYQIEYDTEITNMTKTKFTNKANFLGTETSAAVDIKRGSKIKKSGVPVIDYNEKYITWTIDVNTAEEEINNAIVEDTIGPGLSLVKDSIKVYKLNFNDNGDAIPNGEVESSKYTVTPDQNDSNKFSVGLGTINSAYRIVYRTDITDNDKNGGKGFINQGVIDGIGTGNVSVDAEITNSFNKSADGSIDYAEKTMGWKITVDPKREPIKGLVIEDTFPRGGLTMLPDTFVVKNGNAALIKDVDYKFQANVDGDWTKGFKISFLDDVKDSIYTITYKTKFDPWQVSKAHSQATYSNSAGFTWDNIKEPIDKNATQTITSISSSNGSKSGTLDRDKKEITWNINLNYLSKSMDKIIVEDNIEGNQILDKDSIAIYDYTVEANGNMKLGSLVDRGKYSVEGASDRVLKIIINGPVHSPYRVVFKTKLVGMSQHEYVNTATVGDIDYKAKVSYSDSENFIEKSGSQHGKEISWLITVNKSLSEVENAILVDTLSAGHEVIEDSFIVNRASDNAPYKNFKITVSPMDLATGTQTFKLEFLEKINTMYKISYRTKITTDVDYSKLSNKAYFEGDGITTKNTPFEKEIVVRITDGSGTGSGKLGSLRIMKVDGDNLKTKLKGVEFSLYDSSGKLVGKARTDGNGILDVPRLKFGKYTIKEIGPLSGYQILDEDKNIEVVIDSEQAKEIVVKNYKLGSLEPIEPVKEYGSISIKKSDSKDETKLLSGAVFEVKNSKGEVAAKLTTGLDGLAKIDNLPFGEYKVVEIKAPVEYKLDSKEIKVTINKDKPNIELKVLNEEDESTDITIPEKPNNQGKDGGKTKNPGTKTPSGNENVYPKDGSGKLPKTGESSNAGLYLAGLVLVALGVGLRKRRKGIS